MENLAKNPIGLVLMGAILIYWATTIKKEDEKLSRMALFILGILSLIAGVIFILIGSEQVVLSGTEKTVMNVLYL